MSKSPVRVFVASGIGETNQTKIVDIPEGSHLLDVLRLVETLETRDRFALLQEQICALVSGLENQAALEQRWVDRDFAGCVVDLNITNPDIRSVRSGRYFCVDMLGSRLSLIPLGFEGWQLVEPSFVDIDKQPGVEILAIELGDDEWEHAFDAIVKHVVELENYLGNNGQVSNDDLPHGLTFASGEFGRNKARGLQEAQGELLKAQYMYKLLVACE